MVMKIMSWPPWPPLSSKKFEAVVTVHRIEGSRGLEKVEEMRSLVVEIKWKGQKGVALKSLRRSIKRSFTREEGPGDAGGVVEWNQEFRNVCTFTRHAFYFWFLGFETYQHLRALIPLNAPGHENIPLRLLADEGFSLDLENVLVLRFCDLIPFFNEVLLPMQVHTLVSKQGPKTRAYVAGVTSINLAEYVPAAVDKDTEIVVPLNVPGTNDTTNLSICLSLSLLKLEALQEYLDAVQRSIVCTPSSPCSVEALSTNKDEYTTLKAGLRRVKIFADYVSTGRAKKASSKDEGSDGRSSNRSEDSEYRYTSDADSLDNDAAIKSEENEEDSCVRHSLNYETLASGNCAGGLPYSSSIVNGKDECWIYYGNQNLDYRSAHVENYNTCDQSEYHNSKHRILSWRKRKLHFRSSKVKGELLLKKQYGEEGGDDIDYDRRLLISSDGKWHKIQDSITTSQSFVPEFEENSFTVGNWEQKEVISRDGQMKLHTQIFFASIDQRSEHAAGESACAVLVALIADWLKVNQLVMPIKCEFDNLIRDGSSEWRTLCENKDYIKRFPDKHFDIETVLQAKIHQVSIVPEKSFVGFFIPEEPDSEGFDFLHGAMSFDSIWEEISHCASELLMVREPLVYIVSWNDHFFVLKVEKDAYYIIDTLGERLHEGCNQAYILKFDTSTKIEKLTKKENKALERKPLNVTVKINGSEENVVGESFMVTPNESNDRKEGIICRGKESCKEFIKSFLAAIPIRELQVDVKKGLKASMPLHHRLQIEFHYTHLK
ncbi:unnamed protein product [Sphenostylis stenocarpa]|uniref:C2 NT-type domain-containing protein n=1 Tax=Sphenostylis stenocarpa TaxID=92480 RepID=A0AA86W1E4_9FABA|nr:unnamed protein product [Sphenostylis stenocarpa]